MLGAILGDIIGSVHATARRGPRSNVADTGPDDLQGLDRPTSVLVRGL